MFGYNFRQEIFRILKYSIKQIKFPTKLCSGKLLQIEKRTKIRDLATELRKLIILSKTQHHTLKSFSKFEQHSQSESLFHTTTLKEV